MHNYLTDTFFTDEYIRGNLYLIYYSSNKVCPYLVIQIESFETYLIMCVLI